jgi:glycosyltransferase involved in cell wall biosynthesis
MHTRLNAEADCWLTDRLRKLAYAEVFVDLTQAVLLVQHALAASGCDGAPVTICLRDVFAQCILRTRGLTLLLFAGMVIRAEQALVDAATLVLTLRDKERSRVKSLYAPPRVDVKPFAAPGWCAAAERRSNRIDAGMLVCFGSFDRPESRLAAQWFLRHAWDAVARAVPGLSLKLVGTASDKVAQQFNHPHLSKTSFIPDPSPWFSRCAVAIAPLMHGAGVKFKVLEAHACAVPVVGTSVACEGIEDQPVLTRATPAEFADRVIQARARP